MKYYKYILIFLFVFGGTISCDMDEILEEEAKDFLSPDNSYTDKAGFESALANIYMTIRTNMYANTDSWQNYDMIGLDLDVSVKRVTNTTYTEYFYWNTLNADSEFAKKWWKRFYNWIYQANAIIDRADDDVVSWDSDEDKYAIIGEAKFIRAFAYHFLANMWGGVPLVLNETTSAKFDYTRATQEAVYQQCKEDLEYAVQWMPTVDELDGGRAPRAAAYHLLTEIDICLEDYDGAIAAASEVIDNANFYLMTERFGVRKDFTFNGWDYQGAQESWGDVYWDLFQNGNMNWKEGNHEAIWNTEFEVSTVGGGGDASSRGDGYFGLERWCGTGWWIVRDIDGIGYYLKDTLCGSAAGQGLRVTDYMGTTVWEYKDDWDRDIRNSTYNIQREFFWCNPQSSFYGQRITESNIGVPDELLRWTAPSFMKVIQAVHYGLATHSSSGEKHDYGRIFKDWYIMRLPETYLLRAEAYSRNGEFEKAANDINVVRNRAQATPVTAGDIDLDLILDERARELYLEEFRISTLMRMGKLTEYLMKYNNEVIANGYSLDDHINKMPIPNSVIEANKDVVMEQNTGYN